MCAKSHSNISPNPSKEITNVSETYDKFRKSPFVCPGILNLFRQCAASIYCNVRLSVSADLKKSKVVEIVLKTELLRGRRGKDSLLVNKYNCSVYATLGEVKCVRTAFYRVAVIFSITPERERKERENYRL
jgi:hypothetical protein